MTGVRRSRLLGYKHRLYLAITGLVAVIGIVAWLQRPEHQESSTSFRNLDESVKITLVHADFERNVEVPLAYLGPRFLDLSKRNREGGRQSVVLVQFYYPSMLPDTPDNGYLRDSELLLYASIHTGIPGGTVRRFEFQTTGDSDYMDPTGAEICGLREFQEVSTRTARRSFLYHEDVLEEGEDSYRWRNGKFLGDLHANCAATGASADGVDRCMIHFEFDGGLLATLNAVPKSMLCEWPDVRDKMRTLTEGLLSPGDR